MLREFFTAGSVSVLVSFSCPSTMVVCSPAIKGWLFSTQSTFGLTTLLKNSQKNYLGLGNCLNDTFTFVGHFTNVEFDVNTLSECQFDHSWPPLDQTWDRGGGPIITGECVGQDDSNTLKMFTNLIISTMNVINCT